jgi:prepilin-type N-terminal cleavage/methylation domain-containing protein
MYHKVFAATWDQLQCKGEDRMRHARKGFTLVEIMVVVSIIVLLAAIAIPNLLRSRLSANEAAAIATLKTLSAATLTYFMAQTPMAYPSNLTALSNATPPYIDSTLGSGNRSGYSFNLTGGGNTFGVVASPQSPNVTGVRSFFIDQSGVVRVGNNSSGTPIQ